MTLTIEPGSTSGDCILIPANYSTWNGTPYDEYLLLELFTPNGNNELDWKSWKSSYSADLGFGGIRLYHVDSCLYGYSDTDTLGAWIDDPKNTTYTETETFCNSRLAKDYGYTHLPKEDADCHQIQLIQAGKVNTFGSTDETVNHTLTSADCLRAVINSPSRAIKISSLKKQQWIMGKTSTILSTSRVSQVLRLLLILLSITSLD